MDRITKNQVLKRCVRLGIFYEVSNPGDGLRYNFFTAGDKPYTFGTQLGYALGSREAWIWLNGYATGKGSVG